MKKSIYSLQIKSTFLFWLLLFPLFSSLSQQKVLPGANSLEVHLDLFKNKSIGVIAHQASLVTSEKDIVHLVDFMLKKKLNLKRVFAPEHGFRGTADAGEKIDDQKDLKTQLPIISLYGSNRKPTQEQLQDIELMVFDLQDVGVRFYTYLSTLHYVMEACAENNIPLLVLDRPNPNAHYVDGPVLEKEFSSFVGMHPVPIVYGMTIGEYAQMINGEGWLSGASACDLTVIPISNYTHQTAYEVPVRPSPNLPNAQSIALYPSLCLLEPTVFSVGRGTSKQFQLYGHPKYSKPSFEFTPAPNFGSKSPKHNGELCYGVDLTSTPHPTQIELQWLMDAYNHFPEKESFFLTGFERISGTGALRKQIQEGLREETIRASWKAPLDAFKTIRKKYLIYP